MLCFNAQILSQTKKAGFTYGHSQKQIAQANLLYFT